MSSSSNSQEENTTESSTIVEGIAAERKSSTNNLSQEESVHNIGRPEPFRTNKQLVKQNIPRMESTAQDSSLETPTANWRSLSRQYSEERNRYTSVSNTQSWRDPNFKYERSKQKDTSASREWRNEDKSENRSRSFGDKLAYFPTSSKSRDTSKMGNWTLSCAPDIVLKNGMTEVQYIFDCVRDLHEQNAELFATRSPTVFETPKGDTRINCYTYDYKDKVHVAKVADALIERIGHYPYCFLYFHGNRPLYMRTCEKELYEFIENNWKLIEFEK